MKTIKKYLKIWYLLTINSFSISLISRFGALIFVTGKLIRFFLFLGFIFILVGKTKTLAGYTLSQTILFYLTFNLIDTTIQLFLREVYRFRPMVISGSFDLVLAKPYSPLFRVLAGGADPLDLITLLILILVTTFFLSSATISLSGLFLYLAFCLNAFLIGLSFHIMVVALGTLTTEIDHTIMIYRDLTSLGRLPIDIYQEPLRGFITFVIPVGIMMTFPAKALFGLLSWQMVLISFFIMAVLLLVSIIFWKYALTRYSSASS